MCNRKMFKEDLIGYQLELLYMQRISFAEGRRCSFLLVVCCLQGCDAYSCLSFAIVKIISRMKKNDIRSSAIL